MPGYRSALPQLADRVFLTDSGIETDLIFNHGFELPAFASFPLLDALTGREALARYYADHIAVATRTGAGFVLEAPTWRANADWGRAVGYDRSALDRVNRDAIDFMLLIAGTYGAEEAVVSGCVGPRADGYHPAHRQSADEARAYHRPQIETFASTPADMVHAMTITYPAEAIGIVNAACEAAIPVAVSFTVETDGRLPDGTALADAVAQVDAATDGVAAYFGINCAHPDHIAPALKGDLAWTSRLRTLRANASRRSHAELDEAAELDSGDPADLAAGYVQLRARVPSLSLLGGCCGTDVRHVQAIAALATDPRFGKVMRP
jgi:homocysteine S-methyltransferase